MEYEIDFEPTNHCGICGEDGGDEDVGGDEDMGGETDEDEEAADF